MAITPERLAEWITVRGLPTYPPWIFRLSHNRRDWYESEWQQLSYWKRLRFCQTTWDPRGPEPYADEVAAYRRREHERMARELGYVETDERIGNC